MTQLLIPEMLQALPASLIPRLINVFAATTPELLQHIETAYQTQDAHQFAQAAHKLKGSCVSLGANAMAEICTELQHKGEQSDLSNTATRVQTLKDLYPQTLEALKAAV